MLINRPCPVCGCEEHSLFKPAKELDSRELTYEDLMCTSLSHGSHYQIVSCRKCELQFCSPLIPEKELIDLYKNLSDQNYEYLEYGRIKTAQKALAKFGNPSGKSLLDLGCNTGIFLEVARSFGFEVTGIEPNKIAREKAISARQLRVYSDIGEATRIYDYITLWDVIEHVYDPLELCIKVYNKLARDGEFHLSTMDISALASKLLGSRWPWYMPMHIQYFSRLSMERMLFAAGFKQVKFHYYTHHPSIFYLIGKILIGRKYEKLADRLLSKSKPVIPFNIGDMMHAVAFK